MSAARPTTATGRASAQRRTGSYPRSSQRITRLSSSRWNGPRTSNEHSTGTSVTASNVAATQANVLVYASGWNSLPSPPCSANTGRKARMMMAMANTMGRPTCAAASRVQAMVSEGVSRRPWTRSASSQCRITFSVITIPASTSTPMAMAMPASDMMFEVIPNPCISRKETRMLAGSGSVTIRMERKWNRKMTCASVTSSTSSTSASRSVAIVRAMRSERS